jgi:hypothetical protein
MGWEESFLQDAVNTCTNLSGEITDCALFDIQAASVYDSCSITLPSALVSENVTGPAPTLPGNVPIQSGPGYATIGGGGAETSTAAATSAPTPASSAIAKPSAENANIAVIADATSGAAASSITAAPVLPSSDAASYFSTQYITSSDVVDEILWAEEVVTVTASVTMTLPNRRRHIHQHPGY